jgi:hypothetical protein
MKRTVISAVFAVVGLASMPLQAADSNSTEPVLSRADQPPKNCSLATLRGTYLLTARLDAPAYAHVSGVPQVVGGLRTLDGAGNISGPATVNGGGVIAQHVNAPGVYILNADCTGTMTNAGTRHYDIFAAPDGSEIVGIRTDPGVVEILKLKRVSGRSED